MPTERPEPTAERQPLRELGKPNFNKLSEIIYLDIRTKASSTKAWDGVATMSASGCVDRLTLQSKAATLRWMWCQTSGSWQTTSMLCPSGPMTKAA
jgi:hypothetical protein